MHLGFVGSEREWQRLEAWLAAHGDDRVLAVLPDPSSEPWLDWPATARRLDDFEQLLSEPQIDAVVLAGPVAERGARIRRAVQSGRRCLCFLPVDVATAIYHEVAMMAADTGSVLVPMLAGRVHPRWCELAAACRAGSLGRLRRVEIEVAGAVATGRELVFGEYAEAADLLCELTGDIAELTATGDLAGGRLVVHHRSRSGIDGEVRLVSAPAASSAWTICVEGERGRVQLVFDAGLGGSAQWRGPRGDSRASSRKPAAPADAAAARAPADLPAEPTWQDAIRAAELAECVLYSLDRRRSVDVFNERRDELASFKGTMTSCGCGLIWLTLFLVIAVAAGKGLGIPGTDWLAAALAGLWLLFLGLQAFRWVFPRERPG